MQTRIDWSAYEGGGFGFGFGDGFAEPAQQGAGFRNAAASCQGKLQCQRRDAEVLCPSYRISDDPTHSTYHRAQTLLAAFDGKLGERPFLSPQMLDAMDLCVGCKGCKRECPHGVDMALLSVEARAQRWVELGRVPLRERLVAHIPRLAPRLRLLLNLRARVPGLAWLGERLLGIAARRSMPDVAKRSFLASVSEPPRSAEERGEVVLLVDSFANCFDPQIAQAAVTVLQAAGYRVHLARAKPGEAALCCGRSYLSRGLVDAARSEARRTFDALLPFAQQGIPVVGLEPSCLLMLRDEYHFLGLGDSVPTLASNAWLLEEFLAREIDAGRLQLSLQPITSRRALVHGHCHQKAFGAMAAMEKVLAQIPGLEVSLIESSCCGMAGSFGIEAEHYAASMAMAEAALLPAVRASEEDTVIVANGTSCRHQIRDGAQRRSVHVAQILAAALASGDCHSG